MAIRDEQGYTAVSAAWPLGVWNMDTTAQITYAHDLSATEWLTITDVSVMITNTAQTSSYDLIAGDGSAVAGYIEINNTNILKNRVAAGFFDSATFNNAIGVLSFKYIAD